ncbi:MAG: hypothetical protein GY742_15355 [Hyphomicrobiales bacterium]|nr:hypothetical protein [Hyphomicrobiales bacterium]
MTNRWWSKSGVTGEATGDTIALAITANIAATGDTIALVITADIAATDIIMAISCTQFHSGLAPLSLSPVDTIDVTGGVACAIEIGVRDRIIMDVCNIIDAGR